MLKRLHVLSNGATIHILLNGKYSRFMEITQDCFTGLFKCGEENEIEDFFTEYLDLTGADVISYMEF